VCEELPELVPLPELLARRLEESGFQESSELVSWAASVTPKSFQTDDVISCPCAAFPVLYEVAPPRTTPIRAPTICVTSPSEDSAPLVLAQALRLTAAKSAQSLRVFMTHLSDQDIKISLHAALRLL
jgi:hypothetical protein